uniref:Homing endonuclease LAGLIDADG domain-containing protein n=2 Tax=Pleurastrosarcina brevispinosa TaxID=163096 RepID=Q8WKX2_9CHLO|nr:putative protein [Chlorosarcina brevispinosa]
MENLYMVLDPWWITGFSDGEGCFHISFEKNPIRKLQFRVSFSISQNASSYVSAIQKIAICFGSTGKTQNIRVDRHTVKYETRNVDHIVNSIIPHFEKYPLQSNKQYDFEKFKEICFFIKSEKPLSKESKLLILYLSFEMNLDENKQSRRQYPKSYYIQILEKE